MTCLTVDVYSEYYWKMKVKCGLLKRVSFSQLIWRCCWAVPVYYTRPTAFLVEMLKKLTTDLLCITYADRAVKWEKSHLLHITEAYLLANTSCVSTQSSYHSWSQSKGWSSSILSHLLLSHQFTMETQKFMHNLHDHQKKVVLYFCLALKSVLTRDWYDG